MDAKTTNENNSAAARRTPSKPAAAGQPLTHYHSFFSEIVSWNNPRTSGIAYLSIISLILAARFVDVLRWSLKVSWMVLGVTILAEVAGKLVLNSGLTTQIRPKRYYTVPRDTLDTLIGDVHELINFFVIESQRIIYAESIPASCAAFVAAFISYYLVKLLPYWVLAVISTTVVFFVPLIYATNQEFIDDQIENISEFVDEQTAQVKGVAQKQIDQVSALGKQYAGDYTEKVQELLRGKTASRQVIDRPDAEAKKAEFPNPPTEEPVSFPEVPKEDPVAPQKESVPVA